MKKLVPLLACTLLPLAACEEMDTANGGPSGQFMDPLPEAVAAMADPKQDLNAVRMEPGTGCFVYRYAGPVETTFLPLRTPDGRPICAQKPEPAPAA